MELNKQRPHKINKQFHGQELEKNFVHMDELFKAIQSGRVSAFTTVSAGSTDSESITNLITAFNELVAKLNQSIITKG